MNLLSNWYVRRSRRRFWKAENDDDKTWAYVTLYSCLLTLDKLIAPMTPFVADAMFRNLAPRSEDPSPSRGEGWGEGEHVVPAEAGTSPGPLSPRERAGVRGADEPRSVHLETYPDTDPALTDDTLDRAVRLAMRIASLGRNARSRSGVKVRQPLARVLVSPRAGDEELLPLIESQVLDELNVKAMEVAEAESFATFSLKPNLPVLGPKLGANMGAARQAIAGADAAAVAAAIRSGGYGSIEIGGFTFDPGDFLIEVEDKPGVTAASEGPLLVGIDTTLTPELEAEGTAREFVHRVQNMRKAAGFAIEDRIVTYVVPAKAGTSQPKSEEGEGTAVRPPSPLGRGVGGEGTAVRPPLPTRGEGWGEGTAARPPSPPGRGAGGEGVPLPDALAAQDTYIRQETLSDALHAAAPPPGAYTEEHEIDGATLTVGVVRLNRSHP